MVASAGSPLLVAIDRATGASLDAVRYTLTTILHCAGFAVRLEWWQEGMTPDVYYGPRRDVDAAVQVPAVGWRFDGAAEHEPAGSRDALGVPHLVFAAESGRWEGATDAAAAAEASPDSGTAVEGPLRHPTDVIFGAFWLLSGAAEPRYPRSRFDDLDLDASVLVRERLLARPIVSLLAQRWRTHFERRGHSALPWSWESAGECAFAFSHDVDYPELIRPIEVIRVLRDRGRKGLGLAARVATGASHFWTFREWFPLTARLGTRPCFYFMARQGSLLQYALGTPDDFYDVRAPRFQRLFAELRDHGCEIGLHASYHAHRSTETLRREVQRIRDAAQVECVGNRHHYWHLDPSAPNDTLRRHAEAGLRYDSSLGLEYYPGFRRGICHPFRVYDAAAGSPLPIVQLPPAWMDDHFDRRLARNHITDPDAVALALVRVARQTHGIVVVDYHSRGMNADFYPRYGPWLASFVERHLDRGVRGMTPHEIHDAFLEREDALRRSSSDATRGAAAHVAALTAAHDASSAPRTSAAPASP